MRTLKEFIFETFEKQTLHNVKVQYDAEKEKIVFEAPATYSENDLIIYITDLFLDNMPSGKDNSSKFFGKNAQYIDDAYFEYEKIEHINNTSYSGDIDFEWDKQYDEDKADKDLNYFIVTNLKYTILFSDFEIFSESIDNIDNDINKIFSVTDSNKINTYKIRIRYNPEKLEYNKEDK